jgi:hypothetical protein
MTFPCQRFQMALFLTRRGYLFRGKAYRPREAIRLHSTDEGQAETAYNDTEPRPALAWEPSV